MATDTKVQNHKCANSRFVSCFTRDCAIEDTKLGLTLVPDCTDQMLAPGWILTPMLFSWKAVGTPRNARTQSNKGIHVGVPFLHVSKLVGGFESLLNGIHGIHGWSLHSRAPWVGNRLCCLSSPSADTISGGFTPRTAGYLSFPREKHPPWARGTCATWVLSLPKSPLEQGT